MHNNFYFLRQLSKNLDTRLQGYYVVSCFSQNKDELIIELNNKSESFFIKAHLLPSFSCLSFPSHFHRARKNSVDLFEELILKQFTGSIQYENERSFALTFQGGYSIIFKMHGHRSNVLLSQKDSIIKIFKNQFQDDLQISPDHLHKTIDWSEETFWKHEDRLHEYYFTFGKAVWQHLDEFGFSTLGGSKKWELFNSLRMELEAPDFFITESNDKTRLLLFKPKTPAQHYQDAIEAANEFFLQFITHENLERERQAILKNLTSSILASESYIEKNEAKLKEIEYDSRYKLWADLLMANIHQIPKGSDTVELLGFDQNRVTIKLKPELSPQKNAEIFYRKSKNQEIEINKLRQSIDQKVSQLTHAKAQLQLVITTKTLKELKALNPKGTAPVNEPRKKSERLPYHLIEFKGFQIWVGKNAASNDELTQKFSHKDDLWLHAKDVAGSHVLVKHQPGKPFPKEVVERAAELAAYNSKRKTESLCPVIYTPKKYVRKKKGDAPGTVRIEREEIIMVTPRL